MVSIKELISETRDLIKQPRKRAESKRFVVEGQKVVRDFIVHGADIQYMIFDDDRLAIDESLKDLYTRTQQKGIQVYTINSNRFVKLSDVKTPQGVLAVVAMKEYALDSLLQKQKMLVVMGERIQDPANVGIFVRNCLAFGVDALILTLPSADVYGPKAVRVASSCVLDLPVFYLTMSELKQLKISGISFYASALGTGMQMEQIRTVQPKSAVVFGNEGEGISQEMASLCDTLFTIDISSSVDSLNVVAASAVILYYFTRHR